LERLQASGEAEALRRRHARFFVALAERAEAALRGPEQIAWVARLEQDHDNLRAALRWLADGADAERGLRLAGAPGRGFGGGGPWRFWEVHGHLSEGRRWLEGALARAEGAAPPVRAKALHGAGNLAREQGDYGRAAALLREGLALRRGLGDPAGIAATLNKLG